MRQWMKSNPPMTPPGSAGLGSGRGYVQSASMSSTWKEQLEGIQRGCMGDRSTPMTVAEGISSANSVAQIPVPVPRSRTVLVEGGMGAR